MRLWWSLLSSETAFTGSDRVVSTVENHGFNPLSLFGDRYILLKDGGLSDWSYSHTDSHIVVGSYSMANNRYTFFPLWRMYILGICHCSCTRNMLASSSVGFARGIVPYIEGYEGVIPMIALSIVRQHLFARFPSCVYEYVQVELLTVISESTRKFPWKE